MSPSSTWLINLSKSPVLLSPLTSSPAPAFQPQVPYYSILRSSYSSLPHNSTDAFFASNCLTDPTDFISSGGFSGPILTSRDFHSNTKKDLTLDLKKQDGGEGGISSAMCSDDFSVPSFPLVENNPPSGKTYVGGKFAQFYVLDRPAGEKKVGVVYVSQLKPNSCFFSGATQTDFVAFRFECRCRPSRPTTIWEDARIFSLLRRWLGLRTSMLWELRSS